MPPKFFPLGLKPEILRIDITLKCGQSFRWKQISMAENEWACVLQKKLITLRQTPEDVLYSTPNPSDYGAVKSILHDYFQLDVDLEKLYTFWSSQDPIFAKRASSFGGLRIMRQDPVENLFCFICSSNNNIKRITQMIDKLCQHYGTHIETINEERFYSFPTITSLSQPSVEDNLRKLGFGYRAKYIHQTAKQLLAVGADASNTSNSNDIELNARAWLESLRTKPYEEAKESLLQFSGIGPKVADCVLLMSLNQPGAIPVDTHVWQIANRDYRVPLRKTKTLTEQNYKIIGDFFRKIHGEFAGWAHSILFAADLATFADRKVESVDVGSGLVKEEKIVKVKKEKENEEDRGNEIKEEPSSKRRKVSSVSSVDPNGDETKVMIKQENSENNDSNLDSSIRRLSR